MDLPVLNKFIFSTSLKAGCITMGLFNVFCNLALGYLLIQYAKQIKEKLNDPANMQYQMDSVVYMIEICLVALLAFKLAVDLILVLAVVKGVKYVLTRFCMWWCTLMVLFLVGFLKTMFHLISFQICTQLFFMAQNFYYMILVRSYVLRLEEEEAEDTEEI